MPDNTCQACSKSIEDDFENCSGCVRDIVKALESVPDLIEDLNVSFSQMQRFSGTYDKGSKSAESTLPFDPRASQALRELESLIVGWANVSGSTRHYLNGRAAAIALAAKLDFFRSNIGSGYAIQ